MPAVFRFLAYLFFFLLLFNPSLHIERNETNKKQLFIILDNSSSIAKEKAAAQIQALQSEIENRATLTGRFDLSWFAMGADLNKLEASKDQSTAT